MGEMKKLQVFVSSTYEDLKEERQAAVEAILESGHIPAGMELFSAGDKRQIEVIREWIDKSDVFLLILGGRYGSIEPISSKSYIQLEYEYALERGKPVFAVVIDPDHLEERVRARGSSVLELENHGKLKEFRSLVCAREVKFWNDVKDIKLSIHQTLNEWSRRSDLIGWIRLDQVLVTGNLQEVANLGQAIAAEDLKGVTRKELRDFSRELYGRQLAGIANTIGSLHSNPFTSDLCEEDRDHLMEAVRLSQQAYDILRDLPGLGKYVPLNNLVYYSSLLGIDSKREILLKQGRELRDVALNYGRSPYSYPYFLTYARVVCVYGSDPREVKEALELAQETLREKPTPLIEKEATFIAASLVAKLRDLQNGRNS
jgi:hypothetical protein